MNIYQSTVNKPQQADFWFSFCEKCGGRCCRLPCKALLLPKDIERIAKFTFREDFYTKWRNLYTLRQRRGRCIFHDVSTGLCSIYQARPLDCKTYPLTYRIDELTKEVTWHLDRSCPAARLQEQSWIAWAKKLILDELTKLKKNEYKYLMFHIHRKKKKRKAGR